jgi:hypothetical protein
MHVDHFKPEPDDPLHDSPKRSLIWQFGAKGRRARAYDDIAVLEFGGQCRTGLTCESDLVRLWSHQDYASQSADQAGHAAPLSTNSLRLSWRITSKETGIARRPLPDEQMPVNTSTINGPQRRTRPVPDHHCDGREDSGGNHPGQLRPANAYQR